MRIVRTASRQGSNTDLAADRTIGRVGERPGVGPVAHEHGIAGLEDSARLFLGVCQNAFGRDLADPAGGQVERGNGLRVVDRHFTRFIDDRTATLGRQPFERVHAEPLIGASLKDEAPHALMTGLALGVLDLLRRRREV